MSGDTTYQALERLTYMPDREEVDNGTSIAGQKWYDVYFTGGEISNVALTDVAINSLTSPLEIQYGGTGQSTANDALNALLPDQTGHVGEVLKTDGTSTYWSADIDTGITQLTGDVTAGPGSGSQAATLATVNSNVGAFTYASITVNAKGLITAAASGTAPVTSITVASANGFAGSVTAAPTPAITISTSVTGIVKGNGTALSAAVQGTDYYAPGGTDVAVADGGTNISSYAQGDIIYASGVTTLSTLAKDTNATRYLSNTGTSNNPAWAQVSLSTGVTGNLPVANLNSGTSASSSTFWRGDGTWVSPLVTTSNDVGSVLFAVRPAGAVTWGSTYAGSGLAPSSTANNTGSGSPSGTWRALGETASGTPATLFVRTV